MQHKSPKQLHQQITWTQVSKSKVEGLVLSNLHHLKNEIKFFVAKIAEIKIKTINIFYPTMSPIYVTITFSTSKVETTGFLLIFIDIVF